MRHTILSVTQAKARLLELTKQSNENGEAFLLTRDGSPVAALVPLEEYESILETADVLANPVSLASLEAALEDEQKGRLWKRDEKGRWVKQSKRKHSVRVRRRAQKSVRAKGSYESNRFE